MRAGEDADTRTAADAPAGEVFRILTVRLADISLGGVLLLTGEAIGAGQHAEFRTALGGEAIAAQVRICRVASLPPARPQRPPEVALGAAFVSLDEASRGHIQRFSRAGEGPGEEAAPPPRDGQQAAGRPAR